MMGAKDKKIILCKILMERVFMNIWILNHYAIKPTGIGINRHYSLAKGLVKRGHNVTIVASNFQHRTGRLNIDLEGAKYKEEFFDGIRFIWIDTPSYVGNSIRRVINMVVFALRARFNKVLLGKEEKPDVIVGSSPHPFTALAAERLAACYGVPFVMEVRDLWPLSLIELGGYSNLHPFILVLDYLDRELVKKADIVVTTAPMMKEYYKERFGISDNKFIWVTNGTDLALFKDITKTDKSDGKSNFNIFYSGALGLANGLDVIFDQLKVIKMKYPQVRLEVVGYGPLKEHLVYRAENESLPVRFHEPVTKDKLPAILKNADAFIFYLHPNKIYRYGISLNKLADYHASGRPIIMIGECANNPVKESGAGVVVSSPSEFSGVLGKLLEMDESARREMGRRGVEYAKKNYDWDILVERYAEVMDRAIFNKRQKKGA